MKNKCTETIGIIGSFLLCLCGLPEAWNSFHNKNSNGLTYSFVVLWALGEVFMLTYVIIKHSKIFNKSNKYDFPLLINYIISAFVISIIAYYKFCPN